ncbi:hypothetical protein ACLSZ3_08065 [Avibacterium gallinarum]|uniref:hypothetical protein n=1 Tax=Avibacterium gallinarum TaxID=755 RepID=UPI003BF78DE2
MDLLMNILGYFGTALVVLSFMTNSLLKLRLLNATGAFFCYHLCDLHKCLAGGAVRRFYRYHQCYSAD